MSAPTRKLSLHERFSLMRRNLSFPQPLTALIAYPAASLPTADFLSRRITELQEHFPLLRCEVVNAKTREPAFQQRATSYAPEEILRQASFTLVEGSDGTQEKERILYNELDRMTREDLTRPLWQVTLFTPSSPSDRGYVALSADHILIDGKGLALLTQALLAPDISSLPTETLAQIPLMEDTIDIRPPYSYLLPVVWQELLVPKLPSFLQSYVAQPKPWPGSNIQRSPAECEWGLSLLELAPSLVDALKSAGKVHEVKTLHPILKAAHFVAMWAVLAHNSPDIPFPLKANTPRTERKASLGHAYCTSNYTASTDVQVQLKASDDFWATARYVAHALGSPEGIQNGRYNMGMLSFLPDPIPDPAKADTDRPTGWEEHFYGKLHGSDPFGGSLEVSNLGYAALPEGAEDLLWSSASWPCAPVLNANVVGHGNGLRIVTVWREGAAVTKEQVKEVEKVLRRVLERVAGNEAQESKLKDLAA
ncbi:uncharacterized protein SCHCODRAFT_02222986 [Schizophyllum commune H4-8]|uniref:uncharacterized protein n=1 Tax=Schizophyllum commune (strain H4-8 / FGSC 9210) TaxID=578458 RepID=UPI00215ECB85|nr:uncharacterized protein SCHCODRAFT_02222986 [Schizophyllum commune H4-8]KAI5895068.1 hypothetical protein SCHCODRAFT_02222986 [Schizophyllum commune H4-8]